MVQKAELSRLDLHYESHRMRNSELEARLLCSIRQRGIEEPVECVQKGDQIILLNGFKRYRCAKALSINIIPYRSLGQDEAAGIIKMLKQSNDKSLTIIEQACFVDELHASHKMSVAQISETLLRSKGWVGMRLGLIKEMSEAVRQKIFCGDFPAYSYMYIARPFMRMNDIKKSEIEEFVLAVSGQGLSTREIEQLSHAFFRGPESFRNEVRNGNLAAALECIKQIPNNPDGCNEFEKTLLRDLELLQSYMLSVMGKCTNKRIKNRAFYAQANLLTAGILSKAPAFNQTMREFYDRSAKA